jgi:hypothetical protein
VLHNLQHFREIIARAWVLRFDQKIAFLVFRKIRPVRWSITVNLYPRTQSIAPKSDNIKVEVRGNGSSMPTYFQGLWEQLDCKKRAERSAKASGIEVKKKWTSRAPYWSCGNETKGHSKANLKRGLLESSVAKRTGGRKDRKLDKSQE